MDHITFLCPHCQCCILVNLKELNCRIFRHGIYKSGVNIGKQIDPHMKKSLCDELINKNLIYGCGKPFKIVKVNNIFVAEPCDYI
jgi:hypothetical protein